MDEAAFREEIERRDREIDARDHIIASQQAEIDRLRVAWDEINAAAERRVMAAAVPDQPRRRDRMGMRVIQGGMGAGVAAAVLSAARSAFGAHRAAAAVAAVGMAAAAGAAAPFVLLPASSPGPAVMAGPPAIAAVPYSPARHEQHSRGRHGGTVPPSGIPAAVPAGPGSASPSATRRASHGTKTAGSPSPVPTPSPTQVPGPSPSPPSSPSPSPSPIVSVSIPAPSPSPSPSQCLITILGLCV